MALISLPLCIRLLFLVYVESTAVGLVVACAPVMQRARVRSPVGTSFLGEVFSGFSSPVRQMSGSFRPQGPRISLGHNCHSLRAPMNRDVDAP